MYVKLSLSIIRDILFTWQLMGLEAVIFIYKGCQYLHKLTQSIENKHFIQK